MQEKITKEGIEGLSCKAAEYISKHWGAYSSPSFDRTFSLRNWTIIIAVITAAYQGGSGSPGLNLKKAFSNKKILNIGCGPGYFLDFAKSLGATTFGIEAYCSFPEGLGIRKAMAQDIYDKDSSLYKELSKETFDIITAHEFFVPSIIFKHDEAYKIISKLRNNLKKNGIMAFQNAHEAEVIEAGMLRKAGFNVIFDDLISDVYGISSRLIVIR